MTEPMYAVLCRPRGAETRPLPDGALATHLLYAPTVPVDQLSAIRVLIPGGRVLPPAQHSSAETALVVLSGYAGVLSGPTMTPALPAPGDLVYIPAGVPHSVVNLSHNAADLLLAITTDPHIDARTAPAADYSDAVATRAITLRAEHVDRIAQRRASDARRRR
ncbi:cupin domain-containing protein [Amycolatopsis rubida]|uniref:Cupin domain-containing protein n=1 Tax=Amycolatopsis rubida TaxID=112413 RepID=A0ABX0C2B2_9PSEU|nr:MULTISPECIES: cupin domain-containing protein [Amycolatopsis]MYW94197.1 cupin domain-containing protein [Amycolatopsis rubida]NEC59186.1 cupin domain-containing protein [Amycolatopsis rubida]OAP20872.1 Cupin domain protein [Amycolatopsis sp. M39]